MARHPILAKAFQLILVTCIIFTYATSAASASGISSNAGSPYSWQVGVGNVNTFNGNLLTTVPIVSWSARGGLPVNLSLYHNSETAINAELGPKWSDSYDIYITTDSSGNATVNWGAGNAYTFGTYFGESYQPPAGIHDTLVRNSDGSFTLTKKDQTSYRFTVTPLTNGTGYCVGISDENGNTVTINRNASNLVSGVVDPTGRTIGFGYNAGNKLASVTDPLGREWTFGYDSSGNLSSVTSPVLNGTYYGDSFAYNSNGDITTLTDPKVNAWQYAYNNGKYSSVGADAAISITDPMNHATTYYYSPAGSQMYTQVTDPNGNGTKYYYYNETGTFCIYDKVDAAGYTSAYQWDGDNDETSVRDPNGYTTSYTYDGNGNVLTVTTPLSDTTTTTYNSHNKPLKITDPMGNKTVNTYDTHDNLIEVQKENSAGTVLSSSTATYDGYGELTLRADANNHNTSFGYDTNGDLASVTTPLGNMTKFQYDALGTRTSKTDAIGNTVTYSLDNWERVTSANYPDGSAHTFGYDPDSNLVGFTDGTGTTTRAYDADNRMTSESKNGAVISYAYDGTGQIGLLSSETDQSGRVITYSYTPRNAISQVTDSAGSTTYAYDGDGHVTGETLPNGCTVTNAYNSDGELTSVTNKSAGGTVLSSFSYAYNADEMRTGVTEADGSAVSYSYDNLNELTQEIRTGTNPYMESFTYDAMGNRESETLNGNPITYNYDSDDELLSAGNNSYTYDADGDRISETVNGVTTGFGYDYDNQLVSITTGTSVVGYAYDATGRRVSRTAGGVTTTSLFDGGRVILESQGGSFTGTYTYGVSLIRRNGEFFLYDGLGSARTFTNASGVVTASATYYGYGNTVATSGSTSSPYQFGATSGYRNDGDAGIMQVGARYYDPATGSFLTRDTDLNQLSYVYCWDCPINMIDPSGHSPYDDILPVVGGFAGLIISGGDPLGAGIGTAIGQYIASRMDGENQSTSIRHAVIAGVIGYDGAYYTPTNNLAQAYRSDLLHYFGENFTVENVQELLGNAFKVITNKVY